MTLLDAVHNGAALIVRDYNDYRSLIETSVLLDESFHLVRFSLYETTKFAVCVVFMLNGYLVYDYADSVESLIKYTGNAFPSLRFMLPHRWTRFP